MDTQLGREANVDVAPSLAIRRGATGMGGTVSRVAPSWLTGACNFGSRVTVSQGDILRNARNIYTRPVEALITFGTSLHTNVYR